jgi:hypothetical protein
MELKCLLDNWCNLLTDGSLELDEMFHHEGTVNSLQR